MSVVERVVVPAGTSGSDARDYRYVVERWEEGKKLRVRKCRGCLYWRIGIWNFPQDDGCIIISMDTRCLFPSGQADVSTSWAKVSRPAK